MRFIIGVTGAPYRSDEQRDRILRMAVAAVARHPETAQV
jgi:sulfur relay (sulfurtransferase) complex TusBCD TusD component (DsrE family)